MSLLDLLKDCLAHRLFHLHHTALHRQHHHFHQFLGSLTVQFHGTTGFCNHSHFLAKDVIYGDQQIVSSDGVLIWKKYVHIYFLMLIWAWSGENVGQHFSCANQISFHCWGIYCLNLCCRFACILVALCIINRSPAHKRLFRPSSRLS